MIEPLCTHRQAAPVILSTGELVACVCIECYQQLSDVYIAGQLERAHRIAYCSHARTVEIPEFGRVDVDQLCTECGVTFEQRQLKDANGRYLLSPPPIGGGPS